MNISASPKKVLFLSDLDGTWLSKDKANRAALDQGVQVLRDEFRSQGVDLKFGYVTARPPERVAQEDLPEPDFTITFNGGRIDKGRGVEPKPEGGLLKTSPLPSWELLNQESGFTANLALDKCRTLIDSGAFGDMGVRTIGDVIENPLADDCAFAAHLCFDLAQVQLTEAEKTDANGNDIPDIFEPETFEAPAQLKSLRQALNQGLAEDGVQHEISPLYLFHGKPYAMVDVATPVANKGQAVDFLRRQEGVAQGHLIIAGDGGNDISMMRDPKGQDDGRRAIVVGPETKLRQAAGGLEHCIVEPADKDCSLGVLDGLRRHLEAIVAEG